MLAGHAVLLEIYHAILEIKLVITSKRDVEAAEWYRDSGSAVLILMMCILIPGTLLTLIIVASVVLVLLALLLAAVCLWRR